ncbi:13256_t:CDS:2, partial [Acaulospora colombiana]
MKIRPPTHEHEPVTWRNLKNHLFVGYYTERGEAGKYIRSSQQTGDIRIKKKWFLQERRHPSSPNCSTRQANTRIFQLDRYPASSISPVSNFQPTPVPFYTVEPTHYANLPWFGHWARALQAEWPLTEMERQIWAPDPPVTARFEYLERNRVDSFEPVVSFTVYPSSSRTGGLPDDFKTPKWYRIGVTDAFGVIEHGLSSRLTVNISNKQFWLNYDMLFGYPFESCRLNRHSQHSYSTTTEMSSLFKPAKQKKKPDPSPSGPSPHSGPPGGSSTNSKYQKACDNLIGATKIVKALAEATSFLGPLKSTCEMTRLFLENSKAISESTEGLKALSKSLRSHIDTLEGSWVKLQEKQTEALPTGQQDFIQALNDYIDGLKNTLEKVDEAVKEKAAKALFRKIYSARIEPGVLAAYINDIEQYSKAFEKPKTARLGPERPRPMGTQHQACLKGTREPILQEIRDWRRSKTVEKRIFWLCDIGGSGKSTVAYTMSQEWDEETDILLGRFFFSKNARDTTDTDSFCSTLARDLASKDPGLGDVITNAFQTDSLLTERDFLKQFQKLIVDPLGSIPQDIVFVLDAVDECKIESRRQMLRILLQELASLPNPKILLTSRPEPDIVNLLQDKAVVRGMQFEMQGSKNQSNMTDITSYVDHHLTKLLSSGYRQQIVRQSNGLFIWVSTARFELELAADNPAQFEATLDSLLSRSAGGDLQNLYLGILNRVLRGRFKELICRILGTLAILYEPVSIT